jgi:hypothetical protein
VDRFDGALRLYLQQSHGLFAAVGKLLFDDKARCHLIALIVVFIRVKAVELRPQNDRLNERRQDHVEKRVLERNALIVFRRNVVLDGLQIHALCDIRLVVRAVGIDDAHDKVQRIHIPQQCCVAPVAPASFLFCHKAFFLFFRFCFFSPTLPQVGSLSGNKPLKNGDRALALRRLQVFFRPDGPVNTLRAVELTA